MYIHIWKQMEERAVAVIVCMYVTMYVCKMYVCAFRHSIFIFIILQNACISWLCIYICVCVYIYIYIYIWKHIAEPASVYVCAFRHSIFIFIITQNACILWLIYINMYIYIHTHTCAVEPLQLVYVWACRSDTYQRERSLSCNKHIAPSQMNYIHTYIHTHRENELYHTINTFAQVLVT